MDQNFGRDLANGLAVLAVILFLAGIVIGGVATSCASYVGHRLSVDWDWEESK